MSWRTWWLRMSRDEVPAELDWLSPAERSHVARFHLPRRRDDWLLGRFTVKSALVLAGEATAPQDVSVLGSASGELEVLRGKTRLSRPLSLTLSGDAAVCGIGASGSTLGVNLERVALRPPAFLESWFTGRERGFVEDADDPPEAARREALVWSAKQAVLEVHRGIRLSPRDVEIAPEMDDEPGWKPFLAASPRGVVNGWWRVVDDSVLSLVQEPAPGMPVTIAPSPVNRPRLSGLPGWAVAGSPWCGFVAGIALVSSGSS